jgi:hypothetical protein
VSKVLDMIIKFGNKLNISDPFSSRDPFDGKPLGIDPQVVQDNVYKLEPVNCLVIT